MKSLFANMRHSEVNEYYVPCIQLNVRLSYKSYTVIYRELKRENT